jgi:hypothetical protein
VLNEVDIVLEGYVANIAAINVCFTIVHESHVLAKIRRGFTDVIALPAAERF